MGLEGYEIREVIAQSATTTVRRGNRKSDGVKVVVKSLTREYPSVREIGQLEFEHRILRKLEAPGIIRALDLQREGNRLSLVLEDFGGKSLAVGAAEKLPLARFFPIATAVVRAVGHVHSQNVVHKDITPGNILVNAETGAVKLIDFGISSELSQEHQGGDLATHLEGTLPYLSPEQTGRMNRDLDYRSDYYSLGVVFFELLTGSLPFSATDTMGWVHCHISKAAPNPRHANPAIPDVVARIVLKLMSKNPDERYQSAHGLLRDLESCARQLKETGAIEDFPLGRHDVPERFQVSQTLFGRAQEASALIEVFEEASAGDAKLLLVAGYSGVGKSALINELQKEIVTRRGRFIAGKFDQLERNVPYGAIIQALRGLVKQLLTEPEERFQRWRRNLCKAAGANGQVLVDFMPELEQVLGPQAPVPELNPREARARFQRVFGEFLKAAAQPDHPLVLFVDDLQWADPSTPELLVHLLSDAGVRHLLVIGSYRDNEVHEGHLLLSALAQLRTQRPGAVRQISLQPLTEASVNQLVADTLRCDAETTRPLAQLIAHKTGGNPFFVKELLSALARDGAFRFVAQSGRWHWDYDQISKAAVSENVVDLMVARLRRLPAATLEALCLAACIGNHFTLQTLALVAQKPAGLVAAALWEAVRERVLLAIGSNYRLVQGDHDYDQAGLSALAVRYQFQHDRVQQAAYSLLEGAERARLHLEIGRHLRDSAGASGDENVFEIVNHLNLGRQLIAKLDERVELSRLNEVAGQRARHAAAYAIAASYFEASIDLLSSDEWSVDPIRHFDRRRDHAECILFSGDPERALAVSEELVKSAPDKWTRVSALELKARILDQEARLMEAIGTLREGLLLMGLALPEDPAEIGRQIGEGIGKMQGHLARTAIEDFVRLPEIVDREKKTTMDLLFQLVIPAIQACPPLFILAELLMFDLALTHGTNAWSCKNFVDCGIIQGTVLGDYERAYRLGKVAFEFLKRDASKPLASAVTFVFASFVSPWRAHYKESMESFVDAVRAGLELGDMQHTAYAHTLGTQRFFFVGRELDQTFAQADKAAAALTQIRAANQLDGVVLVQRAAARLRGSPADTQVLRESDDSFTDRLQKSANAQWLAVYGHCQLMTSYFLGDFAAAEKWRAFSEEYHGGGDIQYSVPDLNLFAALLLTRKWAGASPEERAASGEKLKEIQGKLAKWAENCAENFAHKNKLVLAELARIEGAPMEKVIALYDDAVAAAGDDFVHMRALANELQAEYLLANKHAKLAKPLLEEAYYLYQRWGAQSKLRQLEKAHPAVFDAPAQSIATVQTTRTMQGTFRTGAVGGGALDLESMIKATQAISSEVKPDRLFARLMATIIENAGAQRGCLIQVDSGGDLYVEASAHVEAGNADARRHVPIHQYAELSPDIVRYVARTRDTVVINDALHDDSYRDAYIGQNNVKSILCMPVVSQQRLVAILYAENNATTHAFTPQRLRLLQVIASQAAISIANAALYDSLEEKVIERTRELAEKNRDVAAMLDSMEQGIFTIDDRLVIQPQYSAHLEKILETRDIAGRDCLDMLFRDSSVTGDALQAMRAALEFSFNSPTVIAEINAEHFVREFVRSHEQTGKRHFETDWTLIAGDDGCVCKILVALRDVTVLKQLNETVAEKARELDVVGQILDSGLDAFWQFCESTRAFLRENDAVLRASGPLDAGALATLFRNLHTVKGNARLLGLTHLVDAVHRAEESCSEVRKDPSLAGDRTRLFACDEGVLEALDEYEDTCRRKLGDVSTGDGGRSERVLDEIGRLIREAAAGPVGLTQVVGGIQGLIARTKASPLRDVVKESARMLPSLARELEKAPPIVQCLDSGVLLVPAWRSTLRDAFVHAFRNAIDHGIERTEERQAKGKPPQGTICIRATTTDRKTTVRLSDDGQGLRIDALRARTGDMTSPDEEIASKAFLSGLSTAAEVSTVSGRGVGLDAVREFVRRQGGEVTIVLVGSMSDGCRPFELVFELPKDAVLADSSTPGAVETPFALAAAV